MTQRINTRLVKLEATARPRRVLVAWQDVGDPQPDQYRLDGADGFMTLAQIRAHVAQVYSGDDVTLILVTYVDQPLARTRG